LTVDRDTDGLAVILAVLLIVELNDLLVEGVSVSDNV